MKNFIKLLGIVVLVATFMFTMTACDDGNNDNGGDGGNNTCSHVWDTGTVTIPATSTTTGEKKFTCTICGATKTETIPATGSTSQVMDVYSAALKAGQAFTQAAGFNISVYSSGCTWDVNSKILTLSSMYPGNSFNGSFAGTSAQFSFEYEIELTFSSSNTDASITGVRYRIKVTWGNTAFATYTGLGQAPSDSNPLYESWQSSNINTVTTLTQQKAGATVTIRGTTGQITYPN